MTQKQSNAPAGPGLKMADVYYIVFRHKWMILVLTVLGLIAAGVTYSYIQVPWTSQAELLINSVANNGVPNVVKGDETVLGSANTLLNSEVGILEAVDLARMTTEVVPPQRILGSVVAGPNATNEAAALIHQNFHAVVRPGTQIIDLQYSHSDPSVVTDVLKAIIDSYMQRTRAIHDHYKDYVEPLTQEADRSKHTLEDLGQQIAELKTNNDIVDIKASMEGIANQEAAVRSQLADAQLELTTAKIQQDGFQKLVQGGAAAAATNNAAATNDEAEVAAPSPQQLRDYQRILSSLSADQDKLASDSRIFNTNDDRIKGEMDDIAELQGQRDQMEAQFPGLVQMAPSVGAHETSVASGPNLADSLAQLNITVQMISARVEAKKKQLASLEADGARLNQVEADLSDLEARQADAAKTYESLNQEKEKISEEVDLSELAGAQIQVLDPPTPPVRDIRKTSKMVLGIAVSGLILSLVLAALWEMVLDHTLRRPQAVINALKLPYFLTIPYLKGHQTSPSRLLAGGPGPKLLASGADGGPPPSTENKGLVPAGENGAVASWDEHHELRPFHETLRDRLVSYFEMINLTHKPKLVAVTSCSDGAGVSTVATGIASSLSETGDGNVLLVDMNSENGAAHHFYKGKLAMGLEEILEKQKDNRSDARVAENLYVVKQAGNGDKLPSVLPKRFSHLVTKLKASDYDYIILDMPPVSEISITPRLAKFMDMVLLVVESEKTNQDAAQRAAALLTEARANVGVVMNKCRTYVPQRLSHETYLSGGMSKPAAG